MSIHKSLVRASIIMLALVSFFSVNNVSARDFDGKKVDGRVISVKRMNIDEFASSDARIRLKQFAELDNVNKEKDCSQMTEMVNALIDGFDVVSPDNGGRGPSESERDAMLYNTWFLQQLIMCSSQINGKATIVLPEGTFYFVSGHYYMADGSLKVDRHVIKPYDNVTLVGAGTEINSHQTVLKPYSELSEFTNVVGGLDMFFFNDYEAFSQSPYGDVTYLRNNHYYDFVIDSKETQGRVYDTGGKGFMYNLFDSCTWHNITVKNTDGTGIGVDAPIGKSGVYHSRAIGNGKGVKGKQDEGGGSGFGIGTGFRNSESFEIVDSVAEGNGLFGFFYEHQNRFLPNRYLATSGNFKVVNSVSRNNTWNYGGMRSNDSVFTNISSEVGCYKQSTGYEVCTERNVHFSDESRNIDFTGWGADVKKSAFVDAEPNEYYYDALLWAEGNGLAEVAVDVESLPASDNYTYGKTFGVKTPTDRADAVTLIWRMMGRPGDTVGAGTNSLELDASRQATRTLNIRTCFKDVNPKKAYASAVRWAYKAGVTNGVSDCSTEAVDYAYASSLDNYVAPDGVFSPETNITRADFITMLYRLNGSPSVDKIVSNNDFYEFDDVKDKSVWYYDAVYWAANDLNGEIPLTTGVGNNKFNPDASCTREMVITFLYRYWTKYLCEKDCPNLSELLKVDHNR
ncbi:S-layer homology domain-containing protein [Candidatus Saccharibacteria bacterium]|nr:S-layer homology domain-containing protein [Candidatus Saccharibacteria bacterium]